MEQVFLSDIDLFFSSKIINEEKIILEDEEFRHAVKVMRKDINDEIYVTNGKGKIFNSVINSVEKKELTAVIKEVYQYKNELKNFTFCLPILKNKERQEFALEKCIELGFTNFIYYSSEKSFKNKMNIERTNKIALAAMKQSLRSFLPDIKFIGDLKNMDDLKKEIIYLDQKAEISLANYLIQNKENDTAIVIGSESGFSKSEYEYLKEKSVLKLSKNRLRSETAVIYSAVIIESLFR